MKTIIIIVAIHFSLFTQAQSIKYVKTSQNGTGDGSSWANASANLQAMINTAGVNQVWVAAGIYKPTSGTDRHISFVLKSGVQVLGGFNGTETNVSLRDYATNTTILSGNIGNQADSLDNSYHVIIDSTGQNNTAIIDGFIIEHGNANNGIGYPDAYGGAMLNFNASSVKIQNCTFRYNYATYGGCIDNGFDCDIIVNNCIFENNEAYKAAVMNNYANIAVIESCIIRYNYAKIASGIFNDEASPIINNCEFTSNSTPDRGSAISGKLGSSPTISNCTFTNNYANSFSSGGGTIFNDLDCNPVITNCDFINNYSRVGGAIYNNRNSKAQIIDCYFAENKCNREGGAIFNYRSDAIIQNCEFYKNFTYGTYGGAICNSTESHAIIKDCQFLENYKASVGGAIANIIDSNPMISGCTFDSNDAQVLGGAIYAESNSNFVVDSSIFIGNTSVYGGAIYSELSTNIVTNCVFEGNDASNDGGAISVFDNGEITIENCIFYQNNAVNGGALDVDDNFLANVINCTFFNNTGTNGRAMRSNNVSDLQIFNSIVWDEDLQTAQINNYASVSVNFSIVKDGFAGCVSCPSTNGNANPLFTDENSPSGSDGNYFTSDDGLLISSGSPAIGAAEIASATINDILGNLRDDFPDIGAYESTGSNCYDYLNVTGSITLDISANLGLTSYQSNTIPAGYDITYQAGNFIELLPGFSTEWNSVFKTNLIPGCQ